MIQITETLYAFQINPPISDIYLSFNEVKGAGRVYEFNCIKNGKEVSDVLCTVGWGKSCEYICLASEVLLHASKFSDNDINGLWDNVLRSKLEYALIRITN